MRVALAKVRTMDERGMSLVEILVGMTVFAIGLLGLCQVMFGVMHANMVSKNTVKATNLAHQRMEQVISSMRYDSITESNFPDEDFGQIGGGETEYQKFKRTVAIADSTNALGRSVLKEVTVRVEWLERGKTRNVELRSSISRFQDISL